MKDHLVERGVNGNIKLKQIFDNGCEDVDWIRVVQDTGVTGRFEAVNEN